MKKITVLSVSTFCLSLTTLSCGPKAKNVKAPTGEKNIELPCTNFTGTKNLFRATGVGESKDINIAKRKALSNARTQISGEVSTTMKVVGENYVKSTEVDNTEEALERFEENSRTVINQKLNGARSVCERLTKNKEGKYAFYIAIELSGENLVSAYNKVLSKDQKLQVDYNYEKFKKTFDEEMSKRQ